MGSGREGIYFIAFLFLFSPSELRFSEAATEDPIPADWPHQFHALMFMNRTGSLQKLDLWYDWSNGRNFNIIQNQLDNVVTYDLEWNNGTSFVYTLDPSNPTCQVLQVEVGILRPNWLQGATYLGQQRVNNFLCNVWEKVDFIWYYEDVLTRRPVKWIFYSEVWHVSGSVEERTVREDWTLLLVKRGHLLKAERFHVVFSYSKLSVLPSCSIGRAGTCQRHSDAQAVNLSNRHGGDLVPPAGRTVRFLELGGLYGTLLMLERREQFCNRPLLHQTTMPLNQ
ncbi:hypothetical protein V8G54_010803 [Vigna mungo]|uniref:Uncharacterized protein n=1 Tax=Vigna mungo TaxID=3915 RepID=A0AAQ3S6R0_VIGMU